MAPELIEPSHVPYLHGSLALGPDLFRVAAPFTLAHMAGCQTYGPVSERGSKLV